MEKEKSRWFNVCYESEMNKRGLDLERDSEEREHI